MWENLENQSWPQNKESLEWRRYFEYVLETYPTIFKRYEEVTKDHPEHRVDAMKQAFVYIWLHIYDVVIAGITADRDNIMKTNGGPDSQQLSYHLDKVFKDTALADPLINGKRDAIDDIRLENVQIWMDRDLFSLDKTYVRHIKRLDEEISEINKRLSNSKLKEKVLNISPVYHIYKASKTNDSSEEKKEGEDDSYNLVNLELKRTKLRNSYHLLNSIKWKNLLTMEPLDVINTLSLYFQFMFESAQLAEEWVIDRDDLYKINYPDGIEHTY